MTEREISQASSAAALNNARSVLNCTNIFGCDFRWETNNDLIGDAHIGVSDTVIEWIEKQGIGKYNEAWTTVPILEFEGRPANFPEWFGTTVWFTDPAHAALCRLEFG